MPEELTKVVVCCGSCDPKCGHCFEVIEVPLTTDEITQRTKDQADFLAFSAAREAEVAALATLKAEAKAALVAGTPLTPEQADTLIL